MAPDPELCSLATRARRTRAALLSRPLSRDPVRLPTGPGGAGDTFEPLLGLRAGVGIGAVAYPAWVVVDDGHHVADHLIGVAVDRRAHVEIVTGSTTPPLASRAPGDVTVDLGLRCLGLATPPADRPVAAFVDRLWIDRVLERVVLADLGDPPAWPEISRCHPLADQRVCSPEHLRAARSGLRLGWESWRRSVAMSGLGGAVMSSALATWLDTGSFARRLLATLPDPDVVLADLEELLRPADTERLRAALPSHRVT